ncbi:MAG: mechanosensitive ion channel family protein [Alphaproteobacteria bacterium]|nr:mechanosensitive ion channel family protein [Alphaproteobacteria bacterium]
MSGVLSRFLCVAVFSAALFLFSAFQPLQAQTGALPGGGSEDAAAEAVLPDPLTKEAVRALVSELSDEEVRSLLLQRLDAVAESAEPAAPEGGALHTFIASSALGVARSVGDAFISVPEIPGGIATALSTFAERRTATEIWSWFAFLLGALAAAQAAQSAFNRLTARYWDQVPADGAPTLAQSMIMLTRRVVLDFGGIALFMAVAAVIIWRIMPAGPPFQQETAWSFIVAFFLFPKVAAALARFLFAPNRPQMRLMNTDDDTARYLFRWLIILAALRGSLDFVVPFVITHGVNFGEIRIAFWINTSFYALMIWVFWSAREGFKTMLLGKDEQPPKFERMASNAYPTFAITIIALNWLLIELLLAAERYDLLNWRREVTLFLLLFLPVFDTAIRGSVRHLAAPMIGTGHVAEKAYAATRRCYIRMGRILVLGAILYITAKIWGLDVSNIAAAGVGVQLAAGLVELIGVLATGYLVWELVTLLINTKLAKEQTAAGFDLNAEEPGGGEGGGAGGSRLATVLPLMRWMAQAAIVILTVLIALGNLGIDITPLLAGAGIVGLAIGFGAQKLVTDIVSGIFFLIDDAFRTGEYLQIDGTGGTVEKISIRSLQLRHHRGAVHTLPFGEIPKITNFSRDWAIMKLRFTVPFDTDLTKVKKIFKQIGAEMMEIPEYADDFLQPFKSQGVLEVDDVGIVVRGKFMAKPGKQFTLRKEIYGRIQKAFDANGIQFARKEVRVKLDEADHAEHVDGLTEQQKTQIGAAAAQAVGEEAQSDATKPA